MGDQDQQDHPESPKCPHCDGKGWVEMVRRHGDFVPDRYRAECPECTTDDLDEFIVENMKDPEFAAAYLARSEFTATPNGGPA